MSTDNLGVNKMHENKCIVRGRKKQRYQKKMYDR